MLNLSNKLETISNLFEDRKIRSIWGSEREAIKMDMYQKSKMRQEKAKNENREEKSKFNINWYKPNYGKLPMKAYK